MKTTLPPLPPRAPGLRRPAPRRAAPASPKIPAVYKPMAYLREGSIAVWIALAVILFGLAAWGTSSLLPQTTAVERPKPMWMKLPTVETQMADGKMVTMDLNLQMQHQRTENSLDDYKAAMAAVVQERVQTKTRKDFATAQGMTDVSKDLKKSLNRFLKNHDMEQRVQSVEYQQFTLLPQ